MSENDTQPPPPPDLEEKLVVQSDRFERRMDALEDRLEKAGKERSEELKLLHVIAKTLANSEVNENQRHASLDVALKRIETSQSAIMKLWKDVSDEQIRQRQELEMLKSRVDDLEERVEDLEE